MHIANFEVYGDIFLWKMVAKRDSTCKCMQQVVKFKGTFFMKNGSLGGQYV